MTKHIFAGWSQTFLSHSVSRGAAIRPELYGNLSRPALTSSASTGIHCNEGIFGKLETQEVHSCKIFSFGWTVWRLTVFLFFWVFFKQHLVLVLLCRSLCVILVMVWKDSSAIYWVPLPCTYLAHTFLIITWKQQEKIRQMSLTVFRGSEITGDSSNILFFKLLLLLLPLILFSVAHFGSVYLTCMFSGICK